MQYIAILLLAAVTFGICYLFDKGFVTMFRNKVQHRSGLAVRLSKRYAAFGLLLTVLGIAAIFAGLKDQLILLAGGILILVVGIGLIVFYMTFGVFYDEDTLLITTFGKKSTVYSFRDIKGQKLYLIQGGSTVIELHMNDGRAVSLQSTMEGTYPFLDHAFSACCRQKGLNPEACAFHNPSESLWFPNVEDM